MKDISVAEGSAPLTSKAQLLLQLALRCEREEPSRELNFWIWWRCKAAQSGWMPSAEYVRDNIKDPSLPHYATSLDAAVTLVPDGWLIEEMGDDGNGPYAALKITGCTVRLTNGVAGSESSAGTRAAAICAAALRARAGAQP